MVAKQNVGRSNGTCGSTTCSHGYPQDTASGGDADSQIKRLGEISMTTLEETFEQRHSMNRRQARNFNTVFRGVEATKGVIALSKSKDD